jgi:CspA family cold shock protein
MQSRLERKGETKVNGTVKFFSDEKGWGFITPEDGSEAAFVQYSTIRGNGHRTLQQGQRVQFVLVNRDKGPKAANVEIVG